MNSIKKANNLKGKKIIVRVDFNVPLKNGKVFDDFRIRKSLPTIEFLKSKGAKIILISHIGDDGSQSLKPVADYLNKIIPTVFIPTSLGDNVNDEVAKMKNNSVFLLENLRKHEGEKKDDVSFARGISRLGDIYVNEAFSSSHRNHASIDSITKFLPSYMGLNFEEEIHHLEALFKKPEHPFLFILGGAKFETKMPLIKKYVKIADYIFIGGAIANNFFKEQGFEIGTSSFDNKNFGLRSLIKNSKIILPVDVLVTDGKKVSTRKVDKVFHDEKIVDVGEETIKILESYITKSKLVLWNGPLGVYEEGFDKATSELIKFLVKTDAKTIIGGGDTVTTISKLKIENKINFVSTGGGAMIDYLSKGTLPGIRALEKGKN
ncbi:MAG: phosphoglycerate kinase [Candidatus Paceibacterota bacterium]|jgi:phosphoglycerate kinase